jgi:cytochrome c
MSDDLGFNKILGAVLATGLVIVGARQGVDALFYQKSPEKPGYLIEVAEAPAAGEVAAPALLPDWGTVLATTDIAAGEAVFKKCVSCHAVSPDGANMTGPGLWGVVGRPVAAHAGMAYSEAMIAHKTEVPNWTYDALYAYLAAPQKVVKGTKMAFVGIKKSEDRVALIAYLKAQGSQAYPVPAPDAARQPGAVAPADAAAAPAEGVAPATAAPVTEPAKPAA